MRSTFQNQPILSLSAGWIIVWHCLLQILKYKRKRYKVIYSSQTKISVGKYLYREQKKLSPTNGQYILQLRKWIPQYFDGSTLRWLGQSVGAKRSPLIFVLIKNEEKRSGLYFLSFLKSWIDRPKVPCWFGWSSPKRLKTVIVVTESC